MYYSKSDAPKWNRPYEEWCDDKILKEYPFVEEGTGRNEGTLGALVCEYKGNEVRVGTGFSDEKRREIWVDPDNVIGKIISVKYKEETKNKNGSVSIQFPVFEAVRFDKNEESYN